MRSWEHEPRERVPTGREEPDSREEQVHDVIDAKVRVEPDLVLARFDAFARKSSSFIMDPRPDGHLRRPDATGWSLLSRQSGRYRRSRRGRAPVGRPFTRSRSAFSGSFAFTTPAASSTPTVPSSRALKAKDRSEEHTSELQSPAH